MFLVEGKLNRGAALLKGKLSSPGVFMLHRCRNLKRTSPCRLSMKQTNPVIPKGPFALSVKPNDPPPNVLKKIASLDNGFLIIRGLFRQRVVFKVFLCFSIKSIPTIESNLLNVSFRLMAFTH